MYQAVRRYLIPLGGLLRTPLCLLESATRTLPPSQPKSLDQPSRKLTARLSPGSSGTPRRLHDLGYHHAVRGKPPDQSLGVDPNYKRGYEAATRAKSGSPEKETTPSLGHGLHPVWELPEDITDDEIQESLLESAGRAKSQMERSGKLLGKPFGVGLNGVVYASDRPGMVVKMDKGDNEARLARFVTNDPELNKLRALPKFLSATPTGVVDRVSGKEIHAIEREDLHDLPDALEADGLDAFDELRDALNELSDQIVAGEIDRDNYVEAVERHLGESGIYARAASVHPNFASALQDMEELIKRGIMPCDLHISNWGVRRATGEFVMRDVGCFATLK